MKYFLILVLFSVHVLAGDLPIENSGNSVQIVTPDGDPNGPTNPVFVSGSLGRTWNLDQSTDSVTSFQGGAWSVGRVWDLSFADDQVDVSGSTVTVDNFPSTFGRTWDLDFATDQVDVTGSTVAATQSGSWTTGRTWVLSNSTDSVVSFQGTSPWVIDGTVAATQSGTWTTGRTWDLGFATDQVDASGSTVTANIGTTGGLALDTSVDGLEALVTSTNTKLDSAIANQTNATQTAIHNNLTVTGSGSALSAVVIPSTDVSKYASVYLQITGTFSATYQYQFSNDNTNWSLVNMELIAFNNFAPSTQSVGTGVVGCAVKGKYFRTVISAYTSGTVNHTAIFSTAPYSPATVAAILTNIDGVATETTLSSIDAGVPASLGQKTMANSMPVVIASDQSAVPVSVASLPLPSGAATEATLSAFKTANHTDLLAVQGYIDQLEGYVDGIEALIGTSNNSLANIDAGTPAALGQTTMANSQPVVLASDQTSIPVADILQGTTGTQAALTVGTSAVLVNVSGSNLTARKSVTLENNSLVTIYWGYTSGVTTSTGTPIPPGGFREWIASAAVNVYVIAGTSSNNTRVTESP